MTDTKDQGGRKKLTLSLKAPVGAVKTPEDIVQAQVKKPGHGKKPVTIVEVRGKRPVSQIADQQQNAEEDVELESLGGLTRDERSKRLAVLKKAQEILDQEEAEAAEKKKLAGENAEQIVESNLEEEDVKPVEQEKLEHTDIVKEVVEAKKKAKALRKEMLEEIVLPEAKQTGAFTFSNLINKSEKIKEEPQAVVKQDEKTVKPLKQISKSDVVVDEEELDKKTKEKSQIKSKLEEYRRSHQKINVKDVFEEDEEDVVKRPVLRKKRKDKYRKKFAPVQEKLSRDVLLPDIITVSDLANRMSEKATDVVRELMKMGELVTPNTEISSETAEIVIEAMGHTCKKVSDSDVERVFADLADLTKGELMARCPVVTIMGHVDHGKTSLLDAIRQTDVAAGESGGITQHIGAYQITLKDGNHITFLDTPGHEAFTAMRARGAKVTDIVVLVVAADDGIMMQTVEAINHAKAAGVPIIVAINKIDKPEADPNRVKNELLNHSLVPEEYGGDIMTVEVSAKAKLNLDKLEEAILLQAEVLELKANYESAAFGTVIEAKIDKGRGAVSTVLVQKGTLQPGNIVVTGTNFGRVRLIYDDKGKSIPAATPSQPVEIIGLDGAPTAGDLFAVVDSEKQARDIVDYRVRKERAMKSSTIGAKSSVEDMLARVKEGTLKELPIIVKADVNGSMEAIVASLAKIQSNEIKAKLVHAAVGGITESDVILAKATGALIVGFNVRANTGAKALSEKDKVDIRYYSIIYNLIDEVKSIMSGLLDPERKEIYIGMVEIRQVFNITKVGKVAGSFVTDGVVRRGSGVRLLRDNIVIYEGKLKTLRRFKEEQKEVKKDFECGIALENFDDIKEGDRIEAFEVVEEKKTIA